MIRKIVNLTIATLLVALPLGAHSAEKHLKITVYGGTGMIGQRIVNEALNRGDIVTIVVRNPSVVTEKRLNLAVLPGNVLDAADVARNIAGQDVVVEAVSEMATPSVSSGPRAPQEAHFYVHVAQNMVGAARQLGPKAPRLLFVGGAASLRDMNGKLLLDGFSGIPKTSAIYTVKEALDYLRTVKDVSWTVLSPAEVIAPGSRTGKFRLGSDNLIRDANGKSSISAEDYAVAMIDEAHNPTHIRKRFTLGY